MVILSEQIASLLSPENVTAISTIVLALITGFYAFWTYKMAKMQKEEYEISNRPYLSIETMDKKTGLTDIEFWGSIKNSGKTPAVIIYSELDTYDKKEIKVEDVFERPSKVLINPGESINTRIVTLDIVNSMNQYKFNFKIEYKSIINKDKKYSTEYIYKYNGEKDRNLSIASTELS